MSRRNITLLVIICIASWILVLHYVLPRYVNLTTWEDEVGIVNLDDQALETINVDALNKYLHRTGIPDPLEKLSSVGGLSNYIWCEHITDSANYQCIVEAGFVGFSLHSLVPDAPPPTGPLYKLSLDETDAATGSDITHLRIKICGVGVGDQLQNVRQTVTHSSCKSTTSNVPDYSIFRLADKWSVMLLPGFKGTEITDPKSIHRIEITNTKYEIIQH